MCLRFFKIYYESEWKCESQINANSVRQEDSTIKIQKSTVMTLLHAPQILKVELLERKY